MRVVGRTIAAATDGLEALLVIRCGHACTQTLPPRSMMMAACSTNPMPPSDAPANLRVTHVSEDLITVAWDPPTIPNGPIIAYKQAGCQNPDGCALTRLLQAVLRPRRARGVHRGQPAADHDVIRRQVLAGRRDLSLPTYVLPLALGCTGCHWLACWYAVLGVTMAGEGPHSNILLQSTRLNAVKRFERQQVRGAISTCPNMSAMLTCSGL